MKTCQQCKAGFNITDQDRLFYKKLDVSEPALCSTCREQRRLAFRNERRLYRRTCDLSGKPIVSIYSADKPYKVYDQTLWLGDQWDAIEYGRDFDFNRPFFEQFDELLKSVPHPAVGYRFESENCEYTTYQNHSRNCYLCCGSGYMEDCAYTDWTYYAKNSLDTLGASNIELGYELVDCKNAYNSSHSQDSSLITECHHCYDCHSCQNCFGCVNLKNKKFCFLNEQLTPDAYWEKVRTLDKKDFLARYKRLLETSPRRACWQINCEDSVGDHLAHCKNVQDSFYTDESRDCRFQLDVFKNTDCYDCTKSAEDQLSYERIGGGDNYFCRFFLAGEASHSCTYCLFCLNDKNLFGCVGLKRKEYCILNKQYSKEEYEKLTLQIVAHMRKTGEWGELFPITLSPFAYNETMAHVYYPLNKKEALVRGWGWSEYEPEVKATKTIPGARLPDTIKNIPDDVLNWAITCSATSKPFKIISQELQFYRQQNIPLPNLHPDERHKNRLALRNPRQLWDRKCAHCGATVKTTYVQNRSEKIVCEACYLKIVY